MNKSVSQKESKTPFKKIRSAILPIDIIEKDTNGSLLKHRQIHFQINSGKTYHLSYKFFQPQGFHLDKGSHPVVSCYLGDNGLSRHALKFVYVQDRPSHMASDQSELAKPIVVSYIDAMNREQVKVGRIYGELGQTIQVTRRIPVPAGYHLCAGQSLFSKVVGHFQQINLLVKSDSPLSQNSADQSVKASSGSASSASYSSESDRSLGSSSEPFVSVHKNKPQTQSSAAIKHSAVSQSSISSSASSVAGIRSASNSRSSISVSEDYQARADSEAPLSFVNDLNAYRNTLTRHLIKLINQRDSSFLHKVIASLFTRWGRNNLSGLQSHPDRHEVSGLVHSDHTTYVRARNYKPSQSVAISEVRDFYTCVIDSHADKGIFITTSKFTPRALQEAKRHSIVTIDGRKLADLMIKNRIGVQVKHVYRSFEIDHEFF